MLYFSSCVFIFIYFFYLVFFILLSFLQSEYFVHRLLLFPSFLYVLAGRWIEEYVLETLKSPRKMESDTVRKNLILGVLLKWNHDVCLVVCIVNMYRVYFLLVCMIHKSEVSFQRGVYECSYTPTEGSTEPLGLSASSSVAKPGRRQRWCSVFGISFQVRSPWALWWDIIRNI